MIPKTIHLCWFSGDPYPVEIKRCMRTWRKLLPDYQVKVWTEADARALNIDFVNQALDRRAWAFASDVVRFYAVWKCGGVYMDSDIFLYRRFDKLIPRDGFLTFIEKTPNGNCLLQAAFFLGSAGNDFCAKVVDYYRQTQFILPDGTENRVVSPKIMVDVAQPLGFKCEDIMQDIRDDIHVLPSSYLQSYNRAPRFDHTIGVHTLQGFWKKRKLSRKIELKIRHFKMLIRYYILHN